MNSINKTCSVCPRNCNADRTKGAGVCRAGNKIQIAWFGKHFGEEPPISGINGSGTIFFGFCNLFCCYCQNWQISQKGENCREIDNEEVIKIILNLQDQNVHNINFITPTIWSLQLIEIIKEAKKRGLKIPVVWNSNAYEKVETLKKLEGLVDIYLPDFKYSFETPALDYSKAKDYPEFARSAILEMARQVGDLIVDENGIGKKGLIVRHLILPGEKESAKKSLDFIRSVSEDIHLSLMSQYGPEYKAREIKNLNRIITEEEYLEILNYANNLNFNNGWIQELGKSVECFKPDFTEEKPFEKN